MSVFNSDIGKKKQMKIRLNTLLIFGLLALFGLSSCGEQVRIYPNKRVLKVGDNPAWSSPDLDDSKWGQSGRTETMGIFWVRFEVLLDKRIQLIRNKGVSVISLGSYEAYWDGRLIYENGKVGSNYDEEVPGTFISEFIIPDSLCKEENHHLAFRVSNYHNTNFRGSWNAFQIAEYGEIQKRNLRFTAMMFVLGGGYLIAAIYYLLMFFGQRKDQQKLIFSLMCFFFFGLIFMEFYKFLVPYEYHFHFIRLLIIGLITLAISLIVPFFLHVLFELPYRKYFTLAYSIIIAFILGTNSFIDDQTSQLLSTVMLITSLLLTGFAIYLKKTGGIAIIVALLLIVFINFYSDYSIGQLLFYYDINLFVGFTILILAILYLMAQKNKARELAYESSLLKSARLQNELLKKNIQPHFIMNTLTSIMEWVEISPKKSIDFIEALAGEFEILNKIADLKLIPIQQEIDLVNRHLDVMKFRKEVDYELMTHGIEEDEKIPPAILHTIIENGISHSIPIGGKITFHLSFRKDRNQKTYTLITKAKNRIKSKKKSTGTGLKYIRSRLNESYGDKWKLKSEEDIDGWITTIIIE